MQEPSPDRTVVAFDRPIAIVGGGAVDLLLLAELAARDVALVGADGGADAIAAAGLTPALIVGDLDSLADRSMWGEKTRILYLTEQDTTDFEKALYSTSAPLTLALGMTGRRLDHTLAALSAVLSYAPRRRIILVDEVDMALAATGPIRFTADANERVSIHPLLPTRFRTSSGLRYPLDDLLLAPGGRLGTSNAALGGPVEIIPADAAPWLLILGRERLWDFVSALPQ